MVAPILKRAISMHLQPTMMVPANSSRVQVVFKRPRATSIQRPFTVMVHVNSHHSVTIVTGRA